MVRFLRFKGFSGVAGKFAVRAVPKLVLFRNGEMLDEIHGAVGRLDLSAWLDQMAG